jgi:hypothetical protein
MDTPIIITPEFLLSELRRLNPGTRYARYATGSAVGEWIPTSNRFTPVYERTLDDRWVCTIENGMIRETLVNGEPVYKSHGWIE